MYADEEIFEKVSLALKYYGPVKNINEFAYFYWKNYFYPSKSTVERRFGGWKRLIIRTQDWEMKQITCGIMLTGEYKDTSGKATVKIEPSEDYFNMIVSAEGQEYRWKIPRKEV